MTIVKKGTKKAENLIANYRYYTSRNGFIDIHGAYNCPSIYKIRAWNDIERMCAGLNGRGLSVFGHNAMKYSAAFVAVENGIEKLFYFTADYDYVIEL